MSEQNIKSEIINQLTNTNENIRYLIELISKKPNSQEELDVFLLFIREHSNYLYNVIDDLLSKHKSIF